MKNSNVDNDTDKTIAGQAADRLNQLLTGKKTTNQIRKEFGLAPIKEAAKVTLVIDVRNVDEYLTKANRYVDLLKEAKTLAEELASVEFGIAINQSQE